MKRILIAAALGGLCAMPAFAQDAMSADTMTCADYTAMDSAGQMAAAEGMAAMESDAAADAPAEAMTAEDGMQAMTEACTANPDGTVMEAMEMMED